ncbi:uncharacterized protein LOC121418364 [Lytechinus variegatus]|uniref:uncharacterized protein LOC121418364 n=1 Tax=Lytechinus variegatus TaxID=7654 RepID=UPI001BB27F2A|nr:uncharacterized protein LOC121418364 [Lytechinus variegatus]
MSRDPKALDKINMGRTSASYKLTHGLGYVAKKRLVLDMQLYPFSLNVDECFSNNNQKVFSIMVAYFSPEKGETVVHHYNSISLTTVNAKILKETLMSLLKSDNIPLHNLVSILCDSTNYMRGKKGGFETLVRNEASHLLDIDGDTCHHIHNASKLFCKYFDGIIEGLTDDWHTDAKFSTDLREYLREICEILEVPFHMPRKRVPHRWLSVHDVLDEMIDPLTVLYWAWLPKNDKSMYQNILNDILGLSQKNLKRIAAIVQACRDKNLTEQGKARKQRVVKKLFHTRDITLLYIHTYLSVLPLLKSFILTFEQKAPMAHRIHDEQLSLLTSFLSTFIKQEKMKDITAKDLANVDLDKKENHQELLEIFLGLKARKILQKKRSVPNPLMDQFLPTLKAYVDTAKYLLKKLPITNPLLRRLGAIDPVALTTQCHCISSKETA